MTDKIEPALSAEEWAEFLKAGPQASWLTDANGFPVPLLSLHAGAALALHGQPFGFTREDVKELRSAADFLAERFGSALPDQQLRRLAARIEALLPPEPEAALSEDDRALAAMGGPGWHKGEASPLIGRAILRPEDICQKCGAVLFEDGSCRCSSVTPQEPSAPAEPPAIQVTPGGLAMNGIVWKMKKGGFTAEVKKEPDAGGEG